MKCPDYCKQAVFGRLTVKKPKTATLCLKVPHTYERCEVRVWTTLGGPWKLGYGPFFCLTPSLFLCKTPRGARAFLFFDWNTSTFWNLGSGRRCLFFGPIIGPEPYAQVSESVKCRFSKCRFSVLNLKFDSISDGGCTREKQIQKALGSLPPCGKRCRFSESAICSSRVHPPSEIKSNFKFKTLRWRPLRWRLTLSESWSRTQLSKRPLCFKICCLTFLHHRRMFSEKHTWKAPNGQPETNTHFSYIWKQRFKKRFVVTLKFDKKRVFQKICRRRKNKQTGFEKGGA